MILDAGYSRTSVTDLVVATPVFLDLTFVGLESLPELGEERFAAELLRSPGGGAITAVAAARLGLSAAVAAPLGDDVAAATSSATMLAEEGVEWIATRSAPRTPTTVVMPFGGDRAMVTIDPGARASAADVAALEPRAVAASLDQLYVVPDGTTAYVTCGDDDLRAYEGRPPAALGGARALFVNQREALGLSGKDAVRRCSREPCRARRDGRRDAGGGGGDRVQQRQDDRRPRASRSSALPTRPAPATCSTAAYIWADLRGAEPEHRLALGRALRRPRRHDADGHRRCRRCRRRCSARAPRAGSRRRR